jgi:hypothetical protein
MSGLISDKGITSEGDPLFNASPAADVIDSGLGTLFLSDDGTYKAAGADGNGIYDGSDSLSADTTVTMASNKLVFSGTQDVTITAAGELEVGVMSASGLGQISTRAVVGTPAFFVETNADGSGFQDAFTLYNNVTTTTLFSIRKHNTGNYPELDIRDSSGSRIWAITGTSNFNWMDGRMVFGDTSGTNSARLIIKGFGTSNAANFQVKNGSSVLGFDVRDDNRVRVNAGQGASGDFEIYGNTNTNFVSADVSAETLGIGVSSSSIQAKLHIVTPNALASGGAASNALLFENNVGLDLIRIKNNGDIFASGRIMTTQGRTEVSTATYTILATDRTLGVTRTTAGTCVLTMPLASDFKAGTGITIKDEGDNATTNNITINRNGSDKIDGINTQIINSDLDSMKLYSDGVSKWFIK